MLQLAIKDTNDRIDLDRGRITIGREGANTVVLNAGDASGYHAEIHCESDGVYLVDLGSTNGTSVNGKRINQRQKLAAWDRVAFASVEAEIIDTQGSRPTQLLGPVAQVQAPTGGGGWRLVGERESFEISGRHIIGRDPGCDFTVSFDGMSRRHARLELRKGRLLVTDLGSTNGTFVNGQRVVERVLGIGDQVRFDVESFRVQGPVDLGRASVPPAAGAETRVRSRVEGAGMTVASGPAMRLEVASGIQTKSIALTKAHYTVGRAPGSDIELSDDSVSSRHAQLEKTAGGWRLTDLQSTNGTFVNERRIDSVELKPGDRVLFGEVRATFAQGSPQPAFPAGTAVLSGRSGREFLQDSPQEEPRSDTIAAPVRPAPTVVEDSPRPMRRPAPPVAPIRSRPTVGESIRRFPPWGYGVAALLVVAVLAGGFLLLDEEPSISPRPDSSDAQVQVDERLGAQLAIAEGLVGAVGLLGWAWVLVTIPAGIGLLYFGYRLLAFLKFLVGFVIGGTLFGIVSFALGGEAGAVLGFILGGIISGFIFQWLINFIPVVIGALVLAIPTFIYLQSHHGIQEEIVLYGLTGLAAGIGGGIGFWIRVIVEVVGTAVVGAMLIVDGIARIHIESVDLASKLMTQGPSYFKGFLWLYGLLFLGLLCSGVWVQFRYTSGLREVEEKEDEDNETETLEAHRAAELPADRSRMDWCRKGPAGAALTSTATASKHHSRL